MCPACGSREVKRLIYTSQGGLLWTPFLNFIKCRSCKARFHGETGQLDPQVPKAMRIISVLIIMSAVGLLFGIVTSLSSSRRANTSSRTAVHSINAPIQEGASKADPVLLDISQRSIGMGARELPLRFRLYDSGRLEYEVFSKTDPGSTKYVLMRKELQLSAAIVKELIGLAEQPDFLGAPAQYPLLRRMKDSGIVTTVKYTRQGREKKILIKNYDPLHPRAKSYYSASLIRLLERTGELRPKDE